MVVPRGRAPAAIPVGAHTEVDSRGMASMIFRSSVLLPVPPQPVRKTLRLCSTMMSKARCCSSLRGRSSAGNRGDSESEDAGEPIIEDWDASDDWKAGMRDLATDDVVGDRDEEAEDDDEDDERGVEAAWRCGVSGNATSDRLRKTSCAIRIAAWFFE